MSRPLEFCLRTKDERRNYNRTREIAAAERVKQVYSENSWTATMWFSDFWFCCYFQLIIIINFSYFRYCYYWANWAFLNRIAWELLLPVYLRKTLFSYAVKASVSFYCLTTSSSFFQASIMFVLGCNYPQLNRLLITHFFPFTDFPFSLAFNALSILINYFFNYYCIDRMLR